MARTVSVSDYQKQQRGESDASGGREIRTQDAAAVDQLTGQVVDAELSQDDEATERLKALGYGETGLTQARVYDVDGSTGEVRDWRRPDTTPDRGDVTQEHTITDDADPRFSGAGATDEPRDLYAVPADSAFNGKLYRDAPDLANIAERLIGEHGFLSELINAEIRYYWRRKTGVSKGRVKIGYCKRASDLLGHFSGADFIIWLSATTARDGKFTPRQVEAALMHQLLHIEVDDEGNFIKATHDFEGFAAEISAFGVWTEELKVARSAFRAGEQMGLFDETDDDEDEDDDPSADASGLDCIVCGGYVDEERGGDTCDDCRSRSRDDDSDDNEYQPYDQPATAGMPDDADEDILADPKVI